VLKLKSKGLKIGKNELKPPHKNPPHKIEIGGSFVKNKLRNIGWDKVGPYNIGDKGLCPLLPWLMIPHIIHIIFILF